MMKLKANDYISVTRSYLKRYNLYAQYLNNVKEEVRDIDRQLASESIRVSGYGADHGGSSSGLTVVESAAGRRILLEEEKSRLLNDALMLESLMTRLTNAMLRLTPEEQGMIRGFYIDGLGYESLSRRYSYSERWCRKLLRGAEEKLAVMMFGPGAGEAVKFLRTVV